MADQGNLDPYKTMCVITHEGKEVGRIPATATNAEAYINELVRFYKNVSVNYVYDANASLLAELHGGNRYIKPLGEN